MQQDAQMKISRDHIWIRMEEGIGTIGLTNYAQAELGDVISVDLCDIGVKIESGEALGEIESVKTVMELVCPVTGKIVGTNTDLQDHPALVNESPYAEGWLVEVQLKNESELDAMMEPDEYYHFVNREENPI
jgi:glycine cleavage system H protein